MVDDQFGRLTFVAELAAGIRHLLAVQAPAGAYNLTAGGPVVSRAELAREVFRLCGRDPADVVPVSTSEYAEGRGVAPRPRHSGLDLQKICATGFVPRPWPGQLRELVVALQHNKA